MPDHGSRWISANDIAMRDLDEDDDEPSPEWRAEFLARFGRELSARTRFCLMAHGREHWSERTIADSAGISRRKVRAHIAAGYRWLDNYSPRSTEIYDE